MRGTCEGRCSRDPGSHDKHCFRKLCGLLEDREHVIGVEDKYCFDIFEQWTEAGQLERLPNSLFKAIPLDDSFGDSSPEYRAEKLRQYFPRRRVSSTRHSPRAGRSSSAWILLAGTRSYRHPRARQRRALARRGTGRDSRWRVAERALAHVAQVLEVHGVFEWPQARKAAGRSARRPPPATALRARVSAGQLTPSCRSRSHGCRAPALRRGLSRFSNSGLHC